jgi:hypothetical protein
MPLGETLTILATLANAVQVLRTNNRPAEAPLIESAPVVDTMTLMAFEFARTSNEAAVVRHETALSRLRILFVASTVTLLLTAFLGGVGNDSPVGWSALFIASVVLFVVVCLCVIGLRRAFRVTPLTLRDFDAVTGTEQWESMDRLIHHARDLEATNGRRLTMVEHGADALILLIAVQAVLGAVWLIS